MYKYTLTQTPGEYKVYVNLITSNAGRYLSRRPYVINLIKEVLDPMSLKNKPELAIEKDMGRVIGHTDIVDTTEKDTVFYAKPNKTKVYSRYVKNRVPPASNTLSIVIIQDEDGDYEVRDTWIGPFSPPFPGDENESSKSKEYWETHALVQDSDTIQTKTITKNCPY
jgi:hypothetical protein